MFQSLSRDIPDECLLKGDELKSVGEPDSTSASFVQEQEQTYG
jgi:hypothetical protein